MGHRSIIACYETNPLFMEGRRRTHDVKMLAPLFDIILELFGAVKRFRCLIPAYTQKASLSILHSSILDLKGAHREMELVTNIGTMLHYW